MVTRSQQVKQAPEREMFSFKNICKAYDPVGLMQLLAMFQPYKSGTEERKKSDTNQLHKNTNIRSTEPKL